MEFKLLGPIEAEASGRSIPLGPPRQRGILAVLAADAGRLVLMDTLVDRVWGDTPPDRARHSVYTYVARLRGILAGGSAALVRRTHGYLLDVDQDAVDVHRFRRLVVQAREPHRDLRTRTELLRAALAQWRGTPLAAMSGAWADATRQAWQQQRIDAVVAWAEAELSVSGPALVIDTVTGLLAEHPLSEPLAGALIKAMHAAGRRSEALDIYARIRAGLVGQLGVDPSAPLQRTYLDVLRADADQPADDRAAPLPADEGDRVHIRPQPREGQAEAHTGAVDPVGVAVAGDAPAGRSPDEPAAGGPVLYDRDGQLATLCRLAEAAKAGRGSVVLVRGGAGMGKTALLDAWSAVQPAGGMRVVRATAGQPEQDFAFAVVRQVLEPLAGAVEVASATALDAAPLPEVMHHLHQLLARVCQDGPLAVVVDDAHWADAPSLRWLEYLARRVGSLPVLVVVAARPEGSAAEHLSGHILTLPALSSTAMTRWVRQEWPAASVEFCRACADAAGGDPALLAELLRALREQGVEPAGEHVARVAQVADRLRGHAAVRRLFGQDEATHRLVRALVVLGDGADWSIVVALSGLGDAESRDRANRLRRIGVLAAGGDVRFRYPAIRPVLVETVMAPEELAVGHARAAELLHADGASAEQVAEHVLRAEPGPERWRVEVLREAARAARGQGLPETGAKYLRRALREPASATQRGELILELGADEMLADPDAAARRLTLALPGLTDPLLRGRVASLLADALFAAYQHEQAMDMLEGAVADLATPAGSDGLARELWWRLQAQLVLVGYERPATLAAARPWAARLRAHRLAGDTPGQRAVLLALAGPAMIGEGDAATVNDLLDRGLRGELATDPRVTHALGVAGVGYLLTDRLDDAHMRYGQMRDLADRCGAVAASAHAVAGLANVQWRRGDQIPLTPRFDGALRTDLRARLSLLTVAAESLVERGDLEAAAEVLTQHGTGSPDESVRWAPVLMSITRVQAERGDLNGALAFLLAYGGHEQLDGAGNPASTPWRSRAARLHAALGQRQEAKELATQELEAAYRWGTPRVIGAGLACLGTVTGGTEGCQLLAEAVAVLKTSPASLELAWATYEWGLAERQSGDYQTGLGLLGDALELAQSRGARLLAGRVRAELVAAGVRLDP